jgi:hypothetical protein
MGWTLPRNPAPTGAVRGLPTAAAATTFDGCRGPLPDSRSSSEYDRSGVRFRPQADAASPGFLSPSAHEATGSDCPGFASPGYAASPGFFTLLPPCSSRPPPALFQTGNAPGVVPSGGFPSRGTVFHLSVRPARLTFARAAPPARGGAVPRASSGLFPPRESVASFGAGGAATARASPGLSSPPGVDLSVRRLRSSRRPPPGAWRKGRRTSRLPPLPFGVSIARSRGDLLGSLRPSWGSRASCRIPCGTRLSAPKA